MAAPTLAQLRTLLTVVRTGSFTAAAVELNLTQSGVSHAVRGLEEALGARLLERHGRGAQLTEAGRRLFPMAHHILDEAARLRGEVHAVVPLSGTVTIASITSLALRVLPPVLAQLRGDAPEIVVQVRDACMERYAVEAAVLRGEADIGLTQLPVHPRLMARAICTDPFELLVPSDWSAALPWGRPYIHLGPATDDFVMQELRQRGVVLQPTLSLLTDSMIVELVSRGLGYALLPALTLGHWVSGEWQQVELPSVVTRRPMPLPLSRTLGTVTRPGEHSPASRYVLGLIWAVELQYAKS